MLSLENVLLVVLAVCALGMLALVVRRELRPTSQIAGIQGEIISNANAYRSAGNRIGNPTASPIVVFSDYQCPFCRRLDSLLRTLTDEEGNPLDVLYRHFPLEDIHANALEASLMAECAADQGVFAEIHELLFEVADTLGRVPREAIAEYGHIAQAAAFQQCVDTRAGLSRITRDIKAGRRLGVQATPTWIIGNQVVRGTVPDSALRRLIARGTQ